MLNADVCIVGAGPAGTITSMFLSKHKVKHILVERSTFPRDKVCGEFYDGRLRNVLKKLNPELFTCMLQQNILQEINSLRIYNSRLKEVSINASANARVTTVRHLFDDFLLKEALKSDYITYIDDTLIEDIAVNANGVVLASRKNAIELNAKIAVVATGSKTSLAKKAIPGNEPDKHFLLAARGYYTGIPKTPGKNYARFFILKAVVPCYLGIVDLPGDKFLVELFVLKKVAAKYNVNPKTLLQQLIKNYTPLSNFFSNIKLHGHLKGASLPVTSGKKIISAERILLAGDSGYNINPITGLGVGRAVYSGMCAAEQCVKSLDSGNFSASAFMDYDKKVYKAFKTDNRSGGITDFGLQYLNMFSQHAISVVASSPYLKKKTSDLLNKF